MGSDHSSAGGLTQQSSYGCTPARRAGQGALAHRHRVSWVDWQRCRRAGADQRNPTNHKRAIVLAPITSAHSQCAISSPG
jgi:hypothetical protein